MVENKNMDNQEKNVQSDKEIIEELMKDLESFCVPVDEKTAPETQEEPSETNTNSLSDDPIKDTLNHGDPDDKETINDKHKKSVDPLDEEFLKEREEKLSQTEKETLKDEAEKLKNEGNVLFKEGDYTKAMLLYTQGLQTCPLAYSKERAILYSNRAAAKVKCTDDKESAIADCTKAIELNPSFLRAYLRRASFYEETEKLDEALEDYKKVITLDPSHKEANYALRRLPPLIEERNEKLKTEMFSKLKDLGNMVLKPFGLSTNNFELQKDPNSSGYSVKFHQNPK